MDAVLERIEIRLQVDMETGCHRWTGSKDRDGYGLVTVGGKRRRVHREVYERATGQAIPYGYVIDHVKARGCAHRDCCNPAHLEAVPVAVNSQRVNPWNAAKQDCPKGHPYDDDNMAVYVGSDGYVRRYCRTCAAIRSAKRSAKRAAARRTEA